MLLLNNAALCWFERNEEALCIIMWDDCKDVLLEEKSKIEQCLYANIWLNKMVGEYVCLFIICA